MSAGPVVNPDLLIAVSVVFIFVRLNSWLSIFKKIFVGLRLYLAPDNDHVVYLRDNVPNLLEIENIVSEQFKRVKLALVIIDKTVQKSHFIDKKIVYSQSTTSLLLVSIAAVVATTLSGIYHIIYPATPHSSWVIILTLYGLLLALRSTIQILLVLRKRSFELQLSIVFGLFITILSYIPTITKGVDILGLSWGSELWVISNYFRAFVALLSGSEQSIFHKLFTTDNISLLLYISSILFIFILSTSSMLFSIFTTQVLYYIIWGQKYDRLNTKQIVYLIIDILFPLVVAVLFTPGFESLLQHYIFSKYTITNNNTCTNTALDSSNKNSNNTCNLPLFNTPGSESLSFPPYLLHIQVAVLALSALSRLYTVRLYLQGHIHMYISTLYTQIYKYDDSYINSLTIACRDRMKVGQFPLNFALFQPKFRIIYPLFSSYLYVYICIVIVSVDGRPSMYFSHTTYSILNLSSTTSTPTARWSRYRVPYTSLYTTTYTPIYTPFP